MPPSPYYPYPAQARAEPGRIRWMVVLGGILAFAGSLVVGVVYFWLASVDVTAINSFDSIRWTYQVEGAGEILAGIGFMIAFVGLALRSH